MNHRTEAAYLKAVDDAFSRMFQSREIADEQDDADDDEAQYLATKHLEAIDDAQSLADLIVDHDLIQQADRVVFELFKVALRTGYQKDAPAWMVEARGLVSDLTDKIAAGLK